MRQVETPLGYLAIERIGGLDIYMDNSLICELSGKSISDFSYNEKVDVEKLEESIEEELSTNEVMEKITDPYCC